jgi:hypothetical protein
MRVRRSREFLRPRFRNEPCSGDRRKTGAWKFDSASPMPQGPIGRRSRAFCDTNAVTIRVSIFSFEHAKGTMQDDVLDRFFPTKKRSLGTLDCISIVNARPTIPEFLRLRFRNGSLFRRSQENRSLEIR